MRLRTAPLSKQQQALTVLVGMVFGLIVGYVLMGTAHAIFEIGAETSNVRAIRGGKPIDLSGVVIRSSHPPGTIHTLVTGNGSPYQNIQLRIMYGTYKIVQKMPGGDKLTGFTRILHRSSDDMLMAEIPTFRAQPLNPACDEWCAFPVADRPNAVMQWIVAANRNPSMIKGQWILLLESDYVWMKPLQAPDANDPKSRGYLYAFDYIIPTHPNCKDIIKRLSGGLEPSTVPNSGPAPVMLRFAELKRIAPGWERITADIEADEQAKKILDWVREMYAWDIAVAQSRVKFDIAMHPDSPLISQPPHDRSLGKASLYHYTWGTIYKEKGQEIWKFDKRVYTAAEQALRLPNMPMPPAWHQGITLQDGVPVTEELHKAVVDMLTQINKAVDTSKDMS